MYQFCARPCLLLKIQFAAISKLEIRGKTCLVDDGWPHDTKQGVPLCQLTHIDVRKNEARLEGRMLYEVALHFGQRMNFSC